MQIKRSFLGGLFVIGLLLLTPALSLHAAEELKATGVLQAVEADGRIVIDDKGYIGDRNTRVFDGENNEILLYRLGLPSLVRYSYSYTTKGVVISRIQEIPL